TPTLIPRECVHFSSLVRDEWTFPTFDVTTNGLASGNSTAEAVVHGLCELVERDCLTAALRRPPTDRVRIDPESIADPDCEYLLTRVAAADNGVEILDITGDSAIPCYCATITSPTMPVPALGAGCHPDARIALSRALTEAAQSRLGVIAAAR